MLTRTAGLELARHNILVVGVGSGAVATPINRATLDDPAKLAQLDAAIPLGRMANPKEIASVVAFLASYLTATTIFADGGIMHSSVGLYRGSSPPKTASRARHGAAALSNLDASRMNWQPLSTRELSRAKRTGVIGSVRRYLCRNSSVFMPKLNSAPLQLASRMLRHLCRTVDNRRRKMHRDWRTTMRDYRLIGARWFCLLMLAGCAAPAGTASQAPVPALQPDMARVWVLRQPTAPGGNVAGANPMVYANGAPLARSAQGTVFFHDFQPGTYRFTVQPTEPPPTSSTIRSSSHPGRKLMSRFRRCPIGKWALPPGAPALPCCRCRRRRPNPICRR